MSLTERQISRIESGLRRSTDTTSQLTRDPRLAYNTMSKTHARMVFDSLLDIDPTTAHNLILVDIDDLRTAFGGEAATRDPSELQAVPTSTIMCPQW